MRMTGITSKQDKVLTVTVGMMPLKNAVEHPNVRGKICSRSSLRVLSAMHKTQMLWMSMHKLLPSIWHEQQGQLVLRV